MSLTSLSEFDSAIQKANVWLQDLMEGLRWRDRHLACFAMRTDLHALRDHLPDETAVVSHVDQLRRRKPTGRDCLSRNSNEL